MENKVIELKKYQSVREDTNSLTLEETIERLRLNGQIELEHEPISKNAKGDDQEYDEEEEFYINNDGVVLMGFPVYNSEEFAEEGFDGNVEVEKEIFFTEEGKFMVFYTVREYDYCHNCGKVHCKLHRIIARDQSLSLEETEAVLNQLSIELNEEPLFFE